MTTKTITAETATAENASRAALLSIGFLMEMTERALWQSGGRGPWQACLAALVLTLEPGCKARRLLDALPADRAMDQVALLNAMANLGYVGKSAEVSLHNIERRLLPCLFLPHNKTESPFVILAAENGGWRVYDSARHDIYKISGKMTGTLWGFSRYESNAQPTSKFMRAALGHSWFNAIVRRFSGSFWQILAVCLAINVFALAPSLFVMAAYDRVISPADTSALPAILAGVTIALVTEWALREIRAEGLATMTARLDNIVGSRIFSHMIGLPAAMIEQASVAAQVARIKTFESVRDFFSSAVFLSFLEIPFVVIALGVMAVIAGPLVIVPLMVMGAYAVLFAVMRRKIMSAIRLAAKASSARQQFTIDTFENLRSLRINGLTDAWGQKFSTLSGRETVMNFHLGFLGTVAETLAHALTVSAAVFTIGYGAHLIWNGTMTTGALVASMILVWRILLPFYSLCTMIPRLEQLRNSILQVNSLMELDTEAETAKTAAVLPGLKGHVTLKNVSLRYSENDDTLLNGINLDLRPGMIAAITGRNGIGKTSLLKLVKGLYRPTAGSLYIDGFDARQMDAAELRRQISYVPQTPDFFPGTLAENIIIGNPFATPQDIQEALRLAAVHDEVVDLLAKPIDSINLTPGLAARLSLARAYLQNAPILLIDELPNAVLNGAAGRNLREYLKHATKRKTVLIVSHRGDFLQLADIVLRLNRNAPPDTGSYKEMMMNPPKEAA